MTSITKQKISHLFYLARASNSDREKIWRDERLDQIPDDDISAVIDLIKRNRKNNFISPLTVDEFLDAWEGLRMGMQKELF